MFEIIKQSVLIYFVLTFITGLLYPASVTVIAQLAFPDKANGSLIKDKSTGQIVGSELLGQEFTSPAYFWGRLSGTSPAYNAAASSGSNLGPLNPTLKKNIESRIDALKQAGPTNAAVPVDLVTSSGSGLDPDISIASANYQIKRVAKARNISENTIEELVSRKVKNKQMGLLGENRVNVLELNIALDQLKTAERTASGSE